MMISLQDTNSVLGMADWVELSVLYDGLPLSKSKIISIISDNEVDQDTNSEDPDNMSIDEYQLYDSVLQELKRRASMYGDNPPFIIENNVVKPKLNWEDVPELFMCLLFSYWGAANKHSATKLFERLSCEALMSYMGGKAITLGFPNSLSLTEQLNKLAKEISEDRGGRDPLNTDKDRGVDVVGWKSFGDNRKGQIIVLMQCAAGRTWATKKQIPLSAWSQYIHWNYTSTLQCMSITEIVGLNKWQNRIDDYAILIDRARIYRAIYYNGYIMDLNLRDEIKDWCRKEILT